MKNKIKNHNPKKLLAELQVFKSTIEMQLAIVTENHKSIKLSWVPVGDIYYVDFCDMRKTFTTLEVAVEEFCAIEWRYAQYL